MKKILHSTIILSVLLVLSCESKKTPKADSNSNLATINFISKNKIPANELPQKFKDYWYAGEAEITSFKLEQARYGEMREGQAVLIYVTEDFLPTVQVKTDQQNPGNVSVLKLNATKNFNTGIYPYSIMQSTFYPVDNNQHALKVSGSVQEWCGQAYTQLNNRSNFQITSHSYFEGEADQSFSLDKTILENELWTQLRIDPKSLPTGDLQIIPSLEYLRLKHKTIKSYKAKLILTESTYKIDYPELERTLIINFNAKFPFDVLGWTESFKSGSGDNAKILTTTATKLASIKSPYWSKNHNADENLRKILQLN